MFHKKTEMSMPILFILLGIAAFAYSMTIPKDDGMFLKIIALIMIVTSAAILYFVLREQKNVVNMEGVDLKKVIVTVIVLCVYAFLLKYIGYLAATFALAVFTIRYLNYKKWAVIIGFAVFVTLLTYGVFNGLLSVPLPTPFFMD